jgi:hypothetical protein
MAEKDSALSPPDPNLYSGPFSNWLQPQPQQPAQAPQAYPGKGASIAYGIEKFFEGVTRSRKEAYARQEDAKFKRQQGFVSQVNMMLNNPYLSESAKSQIRQQFFQEQGHAIKEMLPKGSGKGKGGGKGKDDTQGQHGLVIHALHDLAEGLTGGKSPKGGPDPGKTGDTLQGTYFNPDGSVRPEFSRTKVLAGITQQYDSATKGAGNLQEAYAATRSLYPNLLKEFGGDEGRAQEFEKRMFAQYSPAGSQADIMGQWGKIGQSGPANPPPNPTPQTSPAPAASAIPVSSSIWPRTSYSPTSPAPAASAIPVARDGAVPPSAPNGRVLTPGELQIAQMAGAAGPLKQLEYDGPDGKPIRVMGREINLPTGAGYFDASGRQISADPSKIRAGTTTEPRQPRAPIIDKQFPGKDGKAHTVAIDPDTRKVMEDYGVTPQAAGTKRTPLPQRPPSATVIAAERKVKGLEAIDKVLSQTPVPPNLDATQAAAYLKQHVDRYYKNDPDVSKYLPEVYDWITSEARKGSFKDPDKVKEIIQNATGQARQDHQNAKVQDSIQNLQQQVQDNVNEILGEQGGQSPSGPQTADEYLNNQ